MATLARTPPSIDRWPPLPLAEWKNTKDTLQRYTQVAGKLLIGLTPLTNHWWNAGLQITARGLTTLEIPWKGGAFQLSFDLIDHELVLQTSWDERRILALSAQPVADFYREVMATLHAVGVDAEISDVPVEVEDRTPFQEDRHHASYDPQAVTRFFQVLLSAKGVVDRFRASFTGKASPVHFFWGSFDLALNLYSGRPAPEREGDPVVREAMAEEDFAVGFWPGDERFGEPAFYAYLAPEPEGFRDARIDPPAARYEAALGEFLLPYEAVRRAGDPDADVLAFFQSTYAAGAELAKWDRARLERPLIVPRWLSEGAVAEDVTQAPPAP